MVYHVVPGAPWLRGTVWGLVVRFLSQAIVMPRMGMGFFSSAVEERGQALIGTLVAYVVSGLVLGAVAGHGVAHADETSGTRRAA